MSFSKGLIFRQENNGGAAVAVDEGESLALAAEVNQASSEIESASGDVTDVVTGIENAGEAVEELQDIDTSMQEAVDSGEGINEREAEHIQARLEHVAKLLGTTTTDMSLSFRRESFGGSGSRLTATKLRQEGVKEWAEKAWKAIVKAWEWLRDAVGNLFTSFTQNAGALEKRLKDLQTRAANATGKQKETKMKSGAKIFSIEGQTGFSQMKTLLTNGTALVQIMNEAVTVVQPEAVNDEDLGQHFNKLKTLLTSKGEKASKAIEGAGKGAVPGTRTTNGEAFVAVPKKITIGSKEIDAFTFSVTKVDEKLADDYQALTQDEIKTLLIEAVSHAKSMKDFQKVEASFKKTVQMNIDYLKKNTNLTEDASKAGADSKDSDADEDRKNFFAAIRAANEANVKICDLTIKHGCKTTFSILQAVADVVSANLANIKEEEKK